MLRKGCNTRNWLLLLCPLLLIVGSARSSPLLARVQEVKTDSIIIQPDPSNGPRQGQLHYYSAPRAGLNVLLESLKQLKTTLDQLFPVSLTQMRGLTMRSNQQMVPPQPLPNPQILQFERAPSVMMPKNNYRRIQAVFGPSARQNVGRIMAPRQQYGSKPSGFFIPLRARGSRLPETVTINKKKLLGYRQGQNISPDYADTTEDPTVSTEDYEYYGESTTEQSSESKSSSSTSKDQSKSSEQRDKSSSEDDEKSSDSDSMENSDEDKSTTDSSSDVDAQNNLKHRQSHHHNHRHRKSNKHHDNTESSSEAYESRNQDHHYHGKRPHQHHSQRHELKNRRHHHHHHHEKHPESEQDASSDVDYQENMSDQQSEGDYRSTSSEIMKEDSKSKSKDYGTKSSEHFTTRHMKTVKHKRRNHNHHHQYQPDYSDNSKDTSYEYMEERSDHQEKTKSTSSEPSLKNYRKLSLASSRGQASESSENNNNKSDKRTTSDEKSAEQTKKHGRRQHSFKTPDISDSLEEEIKQFVKEAFSNADKDKSSESEQTSDKDNHHQNNKQWKQHLKNTQKTHRAVFRDAQTEKSSETSDSDESSMELDDMLAKLRSYYLHKNNKSD
jgi:hypothetical protein